MMGATVDWHQGPSQKFGSGGEHKTKFPVRSQEFLFEAVTFSKNLLTENS